MFCSILVRLLKEVLRGILPSVRVGSKSSFKTLLQNILQALFDFNRSFRFLFTLEKLTITWAIGINWIMQNKMSSFNKDSDICKFDQKIFYPIIYII